MKNIFDPKTTHELIARINALNPDTPALVGQNDRRPDVGS
jgi:hypothetical protein